jgi:hypothetical protein
LRMSQHSKTKRKTLIRERKKQLKRLRKHSLRNNKKLMIYSKVQIYKERQNSKQ